MWRMPEDGASKRSRTPSLLRRHRKTKRIVLFDTLLEGMTQVKSSRTRSWNWSLEEKACRKMIVATEIVSLIALIFIPTYRRRPSCPLFHFGRPDRVRKISDYRLPREHSCLPLKPLATYISRRHWKRATGWPGTDRECGRCDQPFIKLAKENLSNFIRILVHFLYILIRDAWRIRYIKETTGRLWTGRRKFAKTPLSDCCRSPADRSGSSILIYLAASDAPEDMLIYEFEHSKLYRHDLETLCGKMNVLASSLWIGSKTWHGNHSH